MSTSAENYIEQIAVLILQGQAALSGFAVKRVNEDTNPGVNRIVVKASPRQIGLLGKDQMTPAFWRVPVEIKVHLIETSTVSTFDDVIAAIQAAFATGATVPAGATTLAVAQFPGGLQVDDTDEGDWDHTENTRVRSKTFQWVAKI